MSISRDLFSAILAMDAYNRGYNAGIANLNQDAGTGLGNATIVRNAQDEEGVAEAASFYALAYDVGNVAGFSAGETVIAYRGTDNVLGDYFFDGDLWNGWFLGAGDPDAAQAELAISFYQEVAGSEAFWQTANITLTGHSLGGGLAGRRPAVAVDGPMFFAISETGIGQPFDLPSAAGGGRPARACVPHKAIGRSGQVGVSALGHAA